MFTRLLKASQYSQSRSYCMIPKQITVLKNKQKVVFQYLDGKSLVLTASFLRSRSPSASNKKSLLENKHFNDVQISNIEKVGNYAIRIIFSDSHATGIYSWDYIFKLGKEYSNLANP